LGVLGQFGHLFPGIMGYPYSGSVKVSPPPKQAALKAPGKAIKGEWKSKAKHPKGSE
jgi:hypothetical protein